jgi:predicted MFS family arabinose efflux permease
MAATFLTKLKSTLQLTSNPSIPPAGLLWRSNTIFILATVAISLFTDLFLYGLVVPVLPFLLEDRLGVPRDQLQAHVDGLLAAYAGASVVASPLAAVLADCMETRRAPLLLSLAALLLATLLLFVGRELPTLVVARLLQGVCAAAVWTIGFAMSLETVGPENFGKTVGSVSTFLFPLVEEAWGERSVLLIML